MSAVAVTDTLDWKLHGFDLLSEAACQGDFALQHAAWMVGPHYKAAEVAKADWAAVAQGPPWAVDSWGLGCMMQVRGGCSGRQGSGLSLEAPSNAGSGSELHTCASVEVCSRLPSDW
jgi:hypothetical protein